MNDPNRLPDEMTTPNSELPGTPSNNNNSVETIPGL